ncbi:MAG TPA: hypothetical protein VGC13_26975 [Longimicrobium sp.]|uniref:hypothetical protein n=1 Tax=Longimicrobium sp. TaxID=2029185 RepID=UPI002EDAA525
MADEGRDAGIRVERRDEEERGEGRTAALPPQMDVRDEDLEPHAGLRYIARLFKILSILLILLLIAEIVLGLVQQGQSAIPQLLVEATRLVVFAGLLWGAADMGLMLIESNHDLRATRILVGRLNNRVQRLEQIATGTLPGVGAGGRGPTLPPPPPHAPRDRDRDPRAPRA